MLVIPYTHFESQEKAIHALLPKVDMNNKNVLEAGCGSASRFDLSRAQASGIDISPQQLEKNSVLKEKVCADLETYENPAWQGRFDYIICWDVLEHLRHPAEVLKRFNLWLKNGGKMILAFPSPHTLKGIVTKYSPLWIHKLFYFFASRRPLFSKIEIGPFKTYFSKDIRLDHLLEYLETHQLKIEFMSSSESYQNKFLKKFLPAGFVDGLNRLISGKIGQMFHHSANDLIFLISRNEK